MIFMETTSTDSVWSPLISPRTVAPSCLDRESTFYKVLTAPYRPAGTFWQRFIGHSKVLADTAKAGSQIDGFASSTQPTFQPLNDWTWITEKPIASERTVSHTRSGWLENMQLDSAAGHYPSLTISGRRDAMSFQRWMGLRTEFMLYNDERYLKSLQGDVVPRITRVHVSSEEITMLMEPPHPSFWIEASADMPDVLKERCILAFEKIHAHGVLHGNPQLQHMLIGGDGRVTIVAFQSGRSVIPDDAGLAVATESDFRREMGRVKLLLNYRGSGERHEGKGLNPLITRQDRESSRTGADDLYLSQGEEALKDPVASKRSAGEGIPEQRLHDTRFLPSRIVVPGQREEDLKTAVIYFLASLEQDEDNDVVRLPSGSGNSPVSFADKTSGCLLPSPFSSEAFIAQRMRQPPIHLSPFGRESDDTNLESLAFSPSRTEECEPYRSVQQPEAYLELSSARSRMWHPDYPEVEEIFPRKYRGAHSSTERRVRRNNLARCFYAKLPHPELIRSGLIHVDPATLARVQRADGRAVAYGTLKRRFGAQLAQNELASRRARNQERKELENSHARAGRPTPADEPDCPGVLDAGEPGYLPEGPRILTAAELEQRRQLSRSNPSVPGERRGILKRPRPEETSIIGSSINRELEPAGDFENLPPPPPKRIRTTLTRAPTMFRDGSADRDTVNCSFSSSVHLFAPQPISLSAVLPSLRTVSLWMDLLVGWPFR